MLRLIGGCCRSVWNKMCLTAKGLKGKIFKAGWGTSSSVEVSEPFLFFIFFSTRKQKQAMTA